MLKKLIVVVMLICLSATFVIANCSSGMCGKKDEGKMVDKKVKHFTKKLKLDASQQDKLKEIIKKTQDQVKPIMEDCKTKIQEIKKTEDTEIKAILTPQQVEKYDKLMEKKKGKCTMKEEKK